MITSAGKTAYDTDNRHKFTFVKNLLECSAVDYSRSVGKNSLSYLGTIHLFANANQNKGYEARRFLTTGNNHVRSPLNRYSSFKS